MVMAPTGRWQIRGAGSAGRVVAHQAAPETEAERMARLERERQGNAAQGQGAAHCQGDRHLGRHENTSLRQTYATLRKGA
jgi:hypothetical protein